MPDDLDARLSALGAAPAPPLPGAAAARARAAQRSRRGRALLAGTGALLTVLAVLAGTTLASTEPAREADVLDVAPPTRAPVEDPVRAALLDLDDVRSVLSPAWQEVALPEPVLPQACADGAPFGTSAPQQGDTGTAARAFAGPGDEAVGHAVLSFGAASRAAAAQERLLQALASCPPATALPRLDGPSDGPVLLKQQTLEGTAVVAVQQVGPVLSAVRYAADDPAAQALVLAGLAADEVRRSGLLPSPTAPPPPVPPAVPSTDVALLLDAADAAAAAGGQWTASDAAPDRLPLLPCPDRTPPPASSGAMRTLDGPGNASVSSQVLRYLDEAAARALVERVAAEVQRCRSVEQDDGTTLEQVLLPGGEEALLYRRSYRDVVDTVAVTQVGTLVATLVTSEADAVPALVNAARTRLAAEADRPSLEPRLPAPADLEAALGGRWNAEPAREELFPRLLVCRQARQRPGTAGLVRDLVPVDGSAGVGVQVLRYPDEAAARAVLDQYARDVRECPERPLDSGDGTVRFAPLPEDDDDRVDLSETTEPSCAGCAPYGGRTTVVRVGPLVALLGTDGPDVDLDVLVDVARRRLAG